MDIVRGSDLGFYVTLDGNKELLCHATDFTMTVNTDEVEVTGPADGSWRNFIPGLLNYTLTAPGMVAFSADMNIVQLQDIQYLRKTVEWTAALDINGGIQYRGNMFITSINLTSQTRDAARFDMTARGTGPQDIVRIPFTRDVYLANTSNQRLPGCPNPYPVGVLWYDGTFIGVANNPDEVIVVFNEYSAANGNFLTLIGYTSGCDFTMQIAWNSPLNPMVVYAQTGNGFVIGGRFAGEVIGESDDNNNVIGG